MGNVRKQLDTLLNQEMDRKHFLQYSGGILLAVLGITGLVRILLSSGKAPTVFTDDAQKQSHGYGSSRYGQ